MTPELRALHHGCKDEICPSKLLLLAAHAAMLETGFRPAWPGSMYHVPEGSWVSSSICRIQYHLSMTGSMTGGCGQRGQQSSAEARGIEHQAGEGQREAAAPICTLHCSIMGSGVLLAVAGHKHTRRLSLQVAKFVSQQQRPQQQADAEAAVARGRHGAQPGNRLGMEAVELAGEGLLVGGCLQLSTASVVQLWRELKDGLAFPMLLAAYAEAGLPPPAGLLALPQELKQSLLSLLPPVELAAVASTCCELRHVASHDIFWRPLFERDFPHAPTFYVTQAQQKGYKWSFGMCWRERRQREASLRRSRARAFQPAVPRFGVPPPPFHPLPQRPGHPFVIGGDYDRLPQFEPGTGLLGQLGGRRALVGSFLGGRQQRRQHGS